MCTPGTLFADTNHSGKLTYMEALLTFLFFLIAGFYLISLLGRVFFSHWIRKKQRQFSEGKGDSFRAYTWGQTDRSSKRSEGDITVSTTRQTEKKINKNVGDYVDFEEVK